MRQLVVIKDELTLHYGRLETVTKIVATHQKEVFNIFGEKLYQNTHIYQNKTILRMGDGIKTFKSLKDLNQFLIDLFLENINPIKLYNSNQIHKEV